MKSQKSIILLVCLLFLSFLGNAQTVVINEIVSSNITGITDEDGDTPDWIELYNAGNQPVNLQGFGITDNAADLFKWVFPAHIMAPQSYFLVFASGKDRRSAAQWETIINRGDYWKYYVPSAELPGNWRLPGYDDSSWPSGPSGFGYGDDDDATILAPTMSAYIRMTFSVDQLSVILNAVLHVDYDDGFVAYLNGQEIARANIGTPGVIPAFDDSASVVTEPVICYGGTPAGFPVNPAQLLPGENVLAIEVHNFNITSSDLTLIPFFSVLLDTLPPNPSGADPVLNLINPKLHTNFKISGSGELIALTSPSGIVADSIRTGTLPNDVSIGRQPDGTGSWLYFSEPTPENPNTTQSWPGITGTVLFSKPAGFYSSGISVNLSTDTPGDIIYYTLTGDDPAYAGIVYQNPVYILENTVIRAIAVHEGYLPARSVTSSYFINSDHDLPVISLSTSPGNLFDPDTGIYHDNNIWQDWERPIHVEFFEPDDSLGFSLDAGVKIYGAWTRTLPQKSLAIFARKEYGFSEINYPLFPNLDLGKYESFILRNSGNDWQVTMFRDGLMTGLVAEDSIDVAAFRPAAVYINGQYWGLYNIRERLSDTYLESHHGVNKDSLDMLEMDQWVIEGDNMHYSSMISYIQTHPMSVQANYEYVKTQMDVANFITYEITEIFIANTDWPGNNIKYWRPMTAGGKWKWMLYDTDFGFSLVYDFMHNTLAFATDSLGPDWPNPPWSTFLLRQLLKNNEFRIDFINRYADLINSSFRKERILGMIDQKKADIISEMPNQIERWGGITMWDWLNNIQILRDFAFFRKIYAQSHVIQRFDLPGIADVELDVAPAFSGKIKISTLTLEEFPWTGEYFKGVPVRIRATAYPGYRFVRWEGDYVSDSAEITINFADDKSLTAVFESYIPDSLVINEINYNSAVDFNPGDWVEIYNPNNYAVSLSGWNFKDEDDTHSFPFSAGTLLGSKGFLVLCQDTSTFHSLFPEVTNFTGNFNFGLSGNGELIRIFDPSGLVIDTVHYDDVLPWPVEPDGNGPTLELIDPSLDNALPENWTAADQHGTPGNPNGIYLMVRPGQANQYLDCRVVPNPFKGATRFLLLSGMQQDVKVEIYNFSGLKVMSFPPITLALGTHQLIWNGNDMYGNFLAPGIYFCHISAGNNSLTRKVIKVE